jgi:predicted nuclease of predicted toxin-antitoxin system
LKIKLDENLPERLVSELNQLGHDVDTVRAEHLAGQADEQVWQAAQSGNRFLITQDLDFSDCGSTRPEHTPVCY